MANWNETHAQMLRLDRFIPFLCKSEKISLKSKSIPTTAINNDQCSLFKYRKPRLIVLINLLRSNHIVKPKYIDSSKHNCFDLI